MSTKSWFRGPLGLAIVFGLPVLAPSDVSAQTERVTAQRAETEAIEAMLNPLNGRVEGLEAEVRRLEAALESLRATVKTNQTLYNGHGHMVQKFGITPAKSICPDTKATPSTLLPFAIAGQATYDLSGPPESLVSGSR